MKVKDLLWPIVLAASTVVVIVSLFLAFYTAGSYGVGMFNEGLKMLASPALHTLAVIFVFLGLIALVGMTVIALLKVFGVKVPAARLIMMIGAIVAAVSAVAIVLFALLFGNANSALGNLGAGLGLYFAVAGLVIGAVSAFLTRKDLE